MCVCTCIWTFCLQKTIELNRKVPIYLVKILCYWYQHQIMSVQWRCSISKGFNVTNGVRQGDVLSPKLFNVYIDGLSNILNNCTTGGFFGGKCIITCR